MNYIVLSEKVEAYLQDEYRVLCFEQQYIGTYDEYVNLLFHYGTEVRIFNRVHDETEYQIIGKGYYLRVSRHRSNKECFYAFKIDKYKSNSKYNEVFAQTLPLPYEWCIITYAEAANIRYENSGDIEGFLGELKGSYKEYYEFKDKWELWDTYNSKLNELSEKREKESECNVKKAILEHNVFVLTLNGIKNEYKEDETVSVKIKGNDKYVGLGRILSVDITNETIEVMALKQEIIDQFRNNSIEAIETIRITDYGTRARLRRQKDALKRLFDNETANVNLKEILMGSFDYGELVIREDLLNEANGLFGSNLRQEHAYRNALSSDDIFMIQGPPGTGKTTVITEIVKKIVGEGKSVLVSSETNIAVDNVLEKIKHQKGVIAVRLGKEDRIGLNCKKFMPEAIAQTIRSDAINVLESRSNNDNTFEMYKQKIEDKWEKKIKMIDQQIEDIIGILPNADIELLYKDILSYIKNVKLLNNMYEELMESKDEYYKLNEQLKIVKKEFLNVKAKISVAQDNSIKSGFEYADNVVINNEIGLKKEEEKLANEYSILREKIDTISFESKKTMYRRKMLRFDSEKRKLLIYIKDDNDFSREIFALKQNIEELLELKNRRELLMKAMYDEIEESSISYQRDKELLKRSKHIREEWLDILQQPTILDVFEELYLKKTNVVFATCTGIASSDNGIFSYRDYDYVIVDEAAKCNMLDLLIPLVMGKKIILVGDHKQLYPMLETDGLNEDMSEEEIQQLKEHTLFKWMFEERVPAAFKIMMNKQYRMPLVISQFVSDKFYNGELKSEKQNSDKQCMFWIDIADSKEKQKGNSTSYYNVEEAEAICKLLNKIDLSLNEKKDVGIICTYKSQAKYITELLGKVEYKNITWECSTVDAFQGKEKAIIIFNIVRSEWCTSFISDSNRTNVAITRTKEELYIVGNSNICKQKNAGILKDLYNYVVQNGTMYNKYYLES